MKQRVLPEDHSVFMVRPGKGYRLLENFATASAIAPDVPLLDLGAKANTHNATDLNRQIRRGRAWRDWETAPATRRGPPPSKAVGDYAVVPDGGHHARYRSVTFDLLDIMPTGSVVFVPGPSLGTNGLLGRLDAPSASRVEITREVAGHSFSFFGPALARSEAYFDAAIAEIPDGHAKKPWLGGVENSWRRPRPHIP